MRIKAALFAIFALTVAFSNLACHGRKGEPGSRDNPIRFFFMPLKGDDVFEKNAPVIKKFIEENTGLAVEPINSPDFLSIVKAFGNSQADVAFMNTLGYLMARDWAKTEAHLLLLYGDIYRTYRGEILARSDGKVNSPTDLAGKSIAFSDPFSASGYLYALKFLRDHNIKPSQTLFAGGHKEAVEMLYKGEVAAAATYHERPSAEGAERDARAELQAAHPDIFEKLKIIALTDEIPNGPIAFRAGLPAQIKSKLTGALMEFARTPEGRKTLMDLYNVTGLAPASDIDYDKVQEVIKSLGKSVEETVPGGVTFYRAKIGPMLEN